MKTAIILCSALTIAATTVQAEINCKRIGRDPYGTAEQLIVLGDRGAYTYRNLDGNQEVLELTCGSFKLENETGVLCHRSFAPEDGISSEHFLIPRVSDFTSISLTTFVENSPARLTTGKHLVSYDTFPVTCETKE